jgi:hypothetical protein
VQYSTEIVPHSAASSLQLQNVFFCVLSSSWLPAEQNNSVLKHKLLPLIRWFTVNDAMNLGNIEQESASRSVL